MNPRRRTAVTLYVARSAPLTDALGGTQERFDSVRIPLRGLAAPAQGALSSHMPGLYQPDIVLLYLPALADIRVSDGIWLHSTSSQPDYRCVRVERYALHTRAVAERRCV